MNDVVVTKDDVNRNEIRRYLGYGKHAPTDEIESLIEEVLSQALKVCAPKSMMKRCGCRILGEEVYLSEPEDAQHVVVHVTSKNLSDNLAQCEEAIMFACTLGVGADSLLKRLELTDMAKASIAQACFAAIVEAYANKLQEDLRKQLQQEGLYVRPRFSPGYGDLKLDTQRDFFKGMDVAKHLGVTLTDSMLMFPTKSVTAYIGLTKNPGSCHISKCKTCLNKGCEFRDEDNG